MKALLIASATCVVASALPAAAQDQPFTGPSAGVEAGMIDHHFNLDITRTQGGVTTSYNQRFADIGPGAGIFAGYDMAVLDRVRIGGEASLSFGGTAPHADLPFGSGRVEFRPRYGYRLALRAGYVVTPKLMLWATGGYGGNRYRITDTFGVDGKHDWGSSFIVGGGAEYRLSRRVGVRFDYKHVDNQTHQFYLGLPVRF